MVSWESIPFYKIYSYFKEYFDLKRKKSVLIDKEEQLKKWEQELSLLKKIGEENSRNYESMILFIPKKGFIKAEDYIPSPSLDIDFSITNLSIFDFKTKRISMTVYREYDLGPPLETTEIMEVPHQQKVDFRMKLILHTNFINSLKLLKKEGREKSIRFELRDVKIDFTGDREFRKAWGYNTYFELEVPIEDIRVSV